MKSFSNFLVICILLAATTLKSQDNQGANRIRGWASDIDTLLTLIKKEHYVYKVQPLPRQLLIDAENLKMKIHQYSDERMLTELERLMFFMHDGHSYILPVSTKFRVYFLPVQFYVFNDGTYIIDADKPYRDLIGAKVLRIAKMPIGKLLSDMNGFVHQDNKFTVKWFAPSVLRFRSLYENYGIPAGANDLGMDLVLQNGKTISRNISYIPADNFHGIPKLIPSLTAGAWPVPLYLSRVADNFWIRSMPEKKAIYFQFNQVEDKPNKSLASFSDMLDSTLQAERPRLLIIDVRHNNGGNLALLPPLMNVLKHFEQANKTARIVVITGRNTFSAAQVFISLVNRDTHAKFAGEPSSSRPNFVGEGNYISLPYSGAMGSISNKYHETIPGDKRKWIEPDLPVTLSSKEYFSNRDPAIDLVLRKIK